MFLGSSKTKRAAARRRKIVAGIALVGAGVLAYSYVDYKAKEAAAKQAELEAMVAHTDANAATTEGQKQEALGRAIVAEARAKQLKAELAQSQTLAKDTVNKAIASGQPAPPDAQKIAAQAAMAPIGFDFLDFTNPIVLGGATILAAGGWWFFLRKKRR